LLFPFIDFAQDQKIRFEHLTTDEGLSHSNVTCILQDHIGFMWFGTFDGLNKFDGYNFTFYKYNNKNSGSIAANNIYSIYEDTKGNLWLGTTKGLSRYDRDKNIFLNYNEENGFIWGNSNISSILEDNQGNLWIGSFNQGLFLFNPKDNIQIQYSHDEADPKSIASNTISYVFEDSRRNLWISTYGSGVDLFNGETKTFTHIKHHKNDPTGLIGDHVPSIAEDHAGYIWFACHGGGLSRIHIDELDKRIFFNYQYIPGNDRSISNNFIRSLCADKNGGLWIGMENGGLDFLQNDKKTIIHFRNDAGDPNSLNNNSIYSLYQDKTGDLWIGTYAGGVNIIHQTKQAFKYYKNLVASQNSLSNNSVCEFCEDKRGAIWIATDGGGLNRFNPTTGHFQHYDTKNSNLNDDAVLTVFVDSQNKIWIGTWTGGFSLFNQENKSFITFTTENSGLSSNHILDIAEDRQGNLWLATQNGINKFNIRNKSIIVYNTKNCNLLSNFIEVIEVDIYGNLLIGSADGFGIFNPKTATSGNYRNDPKNDNSLSNNFVTSLYEEDSLTVWIGTTNGLNKLNRQSNRITRYYKTNGLPNDFISGIEKDDKGFLWISTNGGISRFDPKTVIFKNYSKEDGLQGNSFNKKSRFKSKNGKIYFGGVNGFNVFDPNDVTENKEIPPIKITDFEIFNKSVDVGSKDSPLKKHITETKEIALSYRQSVLTFGFAAFNYIHPEKNQYAYMLEGFDKEWNYVGTRRTATYMNIDPGRYIFRVKGSNNDGIWNEEGVSLKITISPPFWQTWWFRILSAMFLLGSFFGWYEWRIFRSRKHYIELETLVDERTQALQQSNQELEAFTYSVSHDLRAPLRGMDGFSQALLEDYSSKLDNTAKDYLQRIRGASQRMGQLIDDLLKLSRLTRSEMHFRQVNLSQLAKSIMQEYQEMHPSRNVQMIVAEGLSVKGDAPLIEVMLRNLIDNAWKFTSKIQNVMIEFGATQKDGRTVYYVRDNGIGLDMKYSEKLFEVFQRQHVEFEGTGIGLATVKRIIMRHGGNIWAEGKLNEGATFYFIFGP
jgi:ligand-binding sensor domain-containing protein/signal transduction histidine kinase